MRTDHVWDDVIDTTTRAIYRGYVGPERARGIRGAPAVLAIDLYEAAFAGGPRPIPELLDRFPTSCGEAAWAALGPIQRLLAAAREHGLPIAYSTGETSASVRATKRGGVPHSSRGYAFQAEVAPLADDIVIRKQRASAFFGTPLSAHLVQRGIGTVIVCGETTSGCVRASAVDAYSNGFHVVVVEECCFDRGALMHKVNLFDLHQKYADVMHLNEVVEELARR